MIPGSGRSPEEGNGNQFQYSCLKNPIDRGVWQAAVSSWGHKTSSMTEANEDAHAHTLVVEIQKYTKEFFCPQEFVSFS